VLRTTVLENQGGKKTWARDSIDLEKMAGTPKNHKTQISRIYQFQNFRSRGKHMKAPEKE